jgi:diacylglycerol O-acyltransferase
MERMGGIDPMFIYSETSTSPMEVAYVCVFDPATRERGYSFEAVRELLATRVPALGPFRRRLVKVPLGLDHPRWADDPNFNLDNHLHRAALPAPGGVVELSHLASHIMGRRLDPDLPLWEMHIVEGIEGGKIGLIAKVHHSMIDGVSGAQMLAQLLDITPEFPPPPDVTDTWEPPALPSSAQLVSEAVRNLATGPIRTMRAAREVGRTTFRMLRLARDKGAAALSVPVGAPATFEAPMETRRSVTFTQVDLALVKGVKKQFGITANDVVLAVCSGALRTHMTNHSKCTGESLVAAVPVSVRTRAEKDAGGNRLSAMFVQLGSDKEQPLDRLRDVSAATAAAKVQERAVGYSALATAISDALPPAVAGLFVHLGLQLGAVRRLRPANLVLSNVPGPNFDLYFAGMRMDAVFPIGPIVDGVALNITVQSYCDTLFVGLNASPSAVPDLAGLAQAIVDELSALCRAAGVEVKAAPPETAPAPVPVTKAKEKVVRPRPDGSARNRRPAGVTSSQRRVQPQREAGAA